MTSTCARHGGVCVQSTVLGGPRESPPRGFVCSRFLCGRYLGEQRAASANESAGLLFEFGGKVKWSVCLRETLMQG